MTKYEKGKIIRGTVTGIESYGIFMSFDEYYTGLIHISEVSRGFVSDPNEFVKIGDNIFVEILDVDEEATKLKLSIKNIKYKINGQRRKKRIKETGSGFEILETMLPIWTEKKLKSLKKEKISIDK